MSGQPPRTLMVGTYRQYLEIAAAAAALLAPRLTAASTAEDLFAKTIQPTLTQKCVGCHGEANTFAKLDLRTREAMLIGGSRGPALVPGDAAKSLLFQVLDHTDALQMPPGEKLPAETLAAFRTWIDGGAPFSKTTQAEVDWGKYTPADLWAFYPLKRADPPQVEGAPGPVDAFILGKLREQASNRRRRTIGLPAPTFPVAGGIQQPLDNKP